MSTRRLEEILEECLSAYLDGRRTIEQSLSQYPSVASELEPLLRTATDVSSTFGSYSPPSHVQQRGLNRFLSDARARRNMKTLRVSSVQRGWFGITLQKYRLGFAGAAMAAVVIALSIGAGTVVSPGDDTGGSAVQNPQSTPAAVINLTNAIQTIHDRINSGQAVDPSEIAHLQDAAKAILDAPDEDIIPVSDSVRQQLQEADTLVSNVVANQPEVAQQAAETQGTIRQVAALLPATPTAAPVATATSGTEPTPVVTPVPTTIVPTDTPAPTAAPTPTLPPPPSDTPPPRAPAGFAP